MADGTKKTFHVISPPHIQTNEKFWASHFAPQIANFSKCMLDLGHRVYLYSAANNDFQCTDHIEIMDEAEQIRLNNVEHILPPNPHWEHAHHAHAHTTQRAVELIRARMDKKDFVCYFGGVLEDSMVNVLKPLLCVNISSYTSLSASQFNIYPSYAWMHTCYGANQGKRDASDAEGRYFDAVVPVGADRGKFPFQAEPEDYFVYVGKPIPRLGASIAADVCKETKSQLILLDFDQTTFQFDEYIKLLGRAKAIFLPNQNIAPHGVQAQEAMMCGTPVITSDWGANAEFVQHGRTGFRCRDYGEYLAAVGNCSGINRASVREYAESTFDLEVTKWQYEGFFDQLLQLWDVGFYDMMAPKYNRYKNG